jgi:hypothetical protein
VWDERDAEDQRATDAEELLTFVATSRTSFNGHLNVLVNVPAKWCGGDDVSGT